jgi:hypothetical protein
MPDITDGDALAIFPSRAHIVDVRRVVFLMLALVAGCGGGVAVVPQNGMPRVLATSGPVTITAFAAAWTGDPEDLTDYLTPVAVELYNAGPWEVRVSYADFALRDERGERYAAINPFLPGRYSRVDNPGGVLLASRGGGGGHGGGHFSSGRMGGGSGGHVSVGPPGATRSGSVGAHGGWSGYRVHPGARGWYGGGWLYWGLPFVQPPWYATWVYSWGPGYYPSDRPSADVIDNALPEGVLEPGGHVNGFLYFKKATDRTRQLDLSWDAHEALQGGFVGMARVPLIVVER